MGGVDVGEQTSQQIGRTADLPTPLKGASALWLAVPASLASALPLLWSNRRLADLLANAGASSYHGCYLTCRFSWYLSCRFFFRRCNSGVPMQVIDYEEGAKQSSPLKGD
jgi:hypothetical protein